MRCGLRFGMYFCLECHWKNPVRQQTVHYYNVFWAVKITHTTFLRGSSVFVFYMAVYLVIFLFLQHESGKYRSMKLHRYGKKGYLNHCESKVLHGSLYAVLLVATGLAGIALFGRITGAVIRTGNADMAAAVLLLVKIFLCMVLYGKITVYQILRKNSDFAAFFMLVVLFVHLAAEVYTQKIHFLTYTGAVESLCGILILIVLNTVTELVVRKKINTMDLC